MEESVRNSKVPTWILATVLAWPTLCVVGAAWYVRSLVTELKTEVEARPPLAILDVNEQVMKHLERNPSDSADAATREVYGIGAKLAESGYIVLHKSDLVAYPEEYEVRK